MKKTSFILLLLTAALFAFQADNFIPYKESRKLTWDDYKGPADAASPYQAKTESMLNIDVSAKGAEATITMQTMFDKNKSWVKTRRDELLQHEQTHFDISELWARKFRQRIKGKTFPIATFQATLNSMHADIRKEGHTMQAEYDKETEHSVNAAAQKKWTQKITADLKSLSEFAAPAVTCKLSK
jgi:lipopolysaccharide export LptBFGC system permease protein LptF